MSKTWADIYSPTIAKGAEYDKFQANYVPASQIISSLAEQSGFWWKIDYEGNLFFLPQEENEIDYTLTASEIVGKPEVKEGNPLYRNVQYVRGGFNITDELIETQRGDGDKRSFVLGYKVIEKPKIEVDYGDGFEEKEVGIKGREEDKQWYWERQGSTILQDDSEDILDSSDRVRVTYIGIYPTITVQSDGEAVTKQQALEITTSGRVEDVVNENIKGREAALEFAQSKLNKYAKESTSVSWRTQHPDHEEGQLIKVNLPRFGLVDEKLLINQINILDKKGTLFYDVEAVRGPKHQTWAEFFREMKHRAEKEFREGISAEEILVIPHDFEKIWTDAEEPNIFRKIYPETGPTWEEGFDINQNWDVYEDERWSEGRFDLFPSNELYPSFVVADRIKFMAFYHSGNEVFRKPVSSQSPPAAPPIETETFVGGEEFTGTIDEIKWFGGFRATMAEESGIVIDTVSFNETKTELEAYVIRRVDINEL